MVTTLSAPRRMPVQERGRERFELILDRAATLLAEQGWEALSTNAIAEAAGVPVGSVYQYFPNKEAVVHALATRTLGRLEALVEKLLPEQPRGWDSMVDRLVDSLFRFWRSEPGVMAVRLGGQISEEFCAAERESDRILAERLVRLFETVQPMPPARRAAIAAVLVQVMGPLLSLAAARPREAKVLLEETKRLIKAYLRVHLEAVL